MLYTYPDKDHSDVGSQCGRWNCSHRRPLTERGSALRLLPGTPLKHSPLKTLVRGLGDGGGKGREGGVGVGGMEGGGGVRLGTGRIDMTGCVQSP